MNFAFDDDVVLLQSGLSEPGGPGGGALCVEMGFYVDISWESRCNIEIKVWAHFYKILVFL